MSNQKQQGQTVYQQQSATQNVDMPLPSAIEEILIESGKKHGLSPRSQYDLLRSQIAPGCTDDELATFLYVAKARGLDPFLKQIYAIKRNTKVNGEWVSKMTIQTGIDGYRLIAARTKEHDGTDPVKFTYRDGKDGRPALDSAQVTVYRRGKPYPGEAFWDEYAQDNSMWNKMPRNQLGKCAEALALRRAFPEELSGIYTDEEMGQADKPTVGAILGTIGQKGEAQPTQPQPTEQVDEQAEEAVKVVTAAKTTKELSEAMARVGSVWGQLTGAGKKRVQESIDTAKAKARKAQEKAEAKKAAKEAAPAPTAAAPTAAAPDPDAPVPQPDPNERVPGQEG